MQANATLLKGYINELRRSRGGTYAVFYCVDNDLWVVSHLSVDTIFADLEAMSEHGPMQAYSHTLHASLRALAPLSLMPATVALLIEHYGSNWLCQCSCDDARSAMIKAVLGHRLDISANAVIVDVP